jgi:hypothetical protein
VAAPFIFINTYTIKEGKLDEFRGFLQDLFDVLEANEPRLLAVNAYVNEDGTEAAIVQVHSDGASLKHYWQVVHQHTGRALGQFVDATTRTEVYGKPPSDVVLERTRHSARAGAPVSVKPEHLAGFTRLSESPAPPATDRATGATEGRRHQRPAGHQHN